MSIGEAALANLQTQINNLQTQVNAQGQEIAQFETYVGTQLNNLQTTVNNLQTTVNNLSNKVWTVPFPIQPLPNYNGIQVGGSLTGYLSVYKIPLLDSDNPQFYIFDWVGVTGNVLSYTNDLPWPDMTTPVMYFQSGNYDIGTGPNIYTTTIQGGIYQMQFNNSANTFHLTLRSILSENERQQKQTPDDTKGNKPTPQKIDEIVKEFGNVEASVLRCDSTDPRGSKHKPSTPQIGVQNDRVCFFVFAMH